MFRVGKQITSIRIHHNRIHGCKVTVRISKSQKSNSIDLQRTRRGIIEPLGHELTHDVTLAIGTVMQCQWIILTFPNVSNSHLSRKIGISQLGNVCFNDILNINALLFQLFRDSNTVLKNISLRKQRRIDLNVLVIAKVSNHLIVQIRTQQGFICSITLGQGLNLKACL